jgi:hypothetical protein
MRNRAAAIKQLKKALFELRELCEHRESGQPESGNR